MNLVSENKILIIERSYGLPLVNKSLNKIKYIEREITVDGELIFIEKYKPLQHINNSVINSFISEIAEKQWNHRSDITKNGTNGFCFFWKTFLKRVNFKLQLLNVKFKNIFTRGITAKSN